MCYPNLAMEGLTGKQRAPISQRGFIYICRADNGLVKIGRSTNWKSRLRNLNTALPYALKVLFVFECLLSVEPFLHRKFKSYRIRGEWFDLTDDMVNTIPDYVLQSDPESGRCLSGAGALEKESDLPEWVVSGLKRVQSKGILSMFDVVLYQDSITIEFDMEAKIRALFALVRYYKIPKQAVYEAIMGKI